MGKSNTRPRVSKPKSKPNSNSNQKPAILPYNDWYHCTEHTYGTWLRGDPRGWRSRHHREHVDGDYKHPPPKGKYDKLHAYSKSLMKRDAVKIDDNDRIWFIELAVVHKLLELGIEVMIACFDGVHLHVLARFPDHNPRRWMGYAKKYATQQFKAHGHAVGFNLKLGEGIWAKRGHPEPIVDREHEVNTTNYIADHRKRGALVWVCKALRIASFGKVKSHHLAALQKGREHR